MSIPLNKRTAPKSQFLRLSVAIFGLTLVIIMYQLRGISLSSRDLLIVLALVSAAPSIVDLFFGRFDPFEPIHAVSTASFLYLVVQTINMLALDDFRARGFAYDHVLPDFLVAALVAQFSFYIGYLFTRRFPIQGKGRAAITAAGRAEAHRTAIILFAVVVVALASWIAIAGISLRQLWALGDAGYLAWHNAGGPQIGYLYVARSSLASCVILVIATRNERRWTIIHFLVAGGAVILFLGMGSRALALSCMLGVWMFYFLERQKRPKIIVLAAMLLVSIVFIGVVGFYRVNNVFGQDTITTTELTESVLRSSNLSVTSAAVVSLVPATVDYEWGRSFLKIFVAPIPSVLWPNKYAFVIGSSQQALFAEIFPPGSSWFLWVEFYRNFGPPGIIVGMTILGWLCGLVYRTYSKNSDNVFIQIILALAWAYTFTVYSRHDVASAIVRIVYIFGPVLIVWWSAFRAQNRNAFGVDEQTGRRNSTKTILA